MDPCPCEGHQHLPDPLPGWTHFINSTIDKQLGGVLILILKYEQVTQQRQGIRHSLPSFILTTVRSLIDASLAVAVFVVAKAR